jgi:hypothetical protein
MSGDPKVGSQYWFEYHCWESDESADAPLWRHSHQRVTVIAELESDGQGLTAEERAEAGVPLAFRARWADGFEWCVLDDELLESPSEFYRPDPPVVTKVLTPIR